MSLTSASRRTGVTPAPEAAPGPTPEPPGTPGALAYRMAVRVPGAAAAPPPLEIGAADDPQEHEAEATATRVMRMPDGGTVGGGTPTAAPAAAGPADAAGGEGVQAFLASSAGEPLEGGARAFMEPRFGRGFGDVRVHTGPAAAESARSIGAAAYAVGRDLVFGAGRYQPGTRPGRHLLAHELAHVAQQAGVARRRVQRISIHAYDDADPLHDPSRLSDAQVQATDEYRDFAAFRLPGATTAYATAQEALLAVRLLLRWYREGHSQAPWSNTGLAREFIDRAKRQLGALGGAAGQVGQLNWVPFSTGQAITNPGAMQSDFARWALAGGPQPNAMSGSINCWEMVLFGAFRSGFITFPRIQQIYQRAVANAAANPGTSVGATVETELRGRNAEHTFTPGDPSSPLPLPGDVVIFNAARVHAAISTGTVTSTGDHEVISLWSQPNNISHVQRTTIEAILVAAAASSPRPVKFWSAQW